MTYRRAKIRITAWQKAKQPAFVDPVQKLPIDYHHLTLRHDASGRSHKGPSPCPLVTLRRCFTFLRAQVHAENQGGQAIGYFRAKLMTLGGGFFVHDASGKQVAEVKGDWKGWNFKLMGADGSEWGTVTKQWAGLGKGLFTYADNYIIALNPRVGSDPTLATLLLAAGLAIDTVFKENKG